METHELLKNLLLKEDILKEVVIEGIKFKLRLLTNEESIKVYEGVTNIKDLSNLFRIHTKRVAMSLYEIDGKKIEELLKEAFEDYDGKNEFDFRVNLLNQFKHNILQSLKKEYLDFEDENVKAVKNIKSKDLKNL